MRSWYNTEKSDLVIHHLGVKEMCNTSTGRPRLARKDREKAKAKVKKEFAGEQKN